MAKVAVVIPTKNAEPWLSKQLQALYKQTHKIQEIIVIDSGSTDKTLEIAEKFENVHIINIKPKAFDHGGTRDFALKNTTADYVWFLTQDAIPANSDCLKKLLQPFTDEKVAAVYSKQIAPSNCPRYEQFTRELNYPSKSVVRSLENVKINGVRAYYLSNTCSIYKKSIYESCGGFRYNLPTNEDMLMASTFFNNGYKVGYVAEAVVWHGHDTSFKQIYRRYFDIGAFFSMVEKEIQSNSASKEGISFVFIIFKRLLSEKKLNQAIYFVWLCCARFLGYRMGSNYKKLSPKIILISTQNKPFWNRVFQNNQKGD